MATITADAQVEKMSQSALCILTIIFCYMSPPPFLRKKLDLSSSLVSFTVQVDQNLALYLRL